MLVTRLDKIAQVIRSPRLLRALLWNRVLVGAEHRRALGVKLATAVDIGANRGQFALAARRWAPSARIIAFEPLPEPATIFRELFQGDSRVVLHEAAIGPERGERVIHVSAADDSSSLLPISALQHELFPGTGEVRQEAIHIGPLADFVSRDEISVPALLKVDVQGYELEALRGSLDYLDAFDYVIAEGSFIELYEGQVLAHELVCFLKNEGFILSDIYNIVRARGAAIQADFAFVKEGRRRPSGGVSFGEKPV